MLHTEQGNCGQGNCFYHSIAAGTGQTGADAHQHLRTRLANWRRDTLTPQQYEGLHDHLLALRDQGYDEEERKLIDTSDPSAEEMVRGYSNRMRNQGQEAGELELLTQSLAGCQGRINLPRVDRADETARKVLARRVG